MKKFSAVLLTGVLIVSLAGCSSNKNEKETTTKAKESVTTATAETTIEETTTEEETTKEKATEVPHPSKESKCKTPEEAIQPVCDGFMDADIDEMFSTFPSDLLEFKEMKTVKSELKDVLKQLEEMKEDGMTYDISTSDVGEPTSTDMDDLNQQFADLGMDFRITELKSVGLTMTVSAEGESMSQDVMKCIAGKIGKYWYFITAEQ